MVNMKKNNSTINDSIIQMQDILKSKLLEKDISQPRIIHVETRAKCNGECSFCLANFHIDPREDISMRNELIEKIINDLSNINYKNRISFYLEFNS
jgi:biotin synthase-like enzyme